ncbi:hypothetical protein COU57_03030 [Candidatus Pacearchaeota archaeon CG10_big_fil_rev_8_21_14_0_10_32_14]|nr:MAG: hypothetical protein COU57_03030 [Candidatus Pacearchaeota archaeon CG10_big_fil_rev_8_21_14_0_10_32_14]
MEETEIEICSGIIDGLKGRYKFGYLERYGLPFLTLREGEKSKVGGLVIDETDIISMYPLNPYDYFNDIHGLSVEQRRHLSQESKHLAHYASRIKSNFFGEGDDDQITHDLRFLVRAEKLFLNPDLRRINKKRTTVI